MKTFTALSGLIIFATACGGGPPKVLEPSKYSRTCHSDSDCVQVFFGEVCAPCQCPNGVVNQEGLKKYQADKGATSCPARGELCGPCEQVLAACGTDGNCQLKGQGP